MYCPQNQQVGVMFQKSVLPKYVTGSLWEIFQENLLLS